MEKLNGHPKKPEQPAAERVGFAFTAQQWDMVSGLAAQLIESTQRAVLEHYSRYHTRQGFERGEFIENIASIAANQAFATARHFVAHHHINAERIAQHEREVQDSVARAAEELRRKSLGLPPEGDGREAAATTGEADEPRLETP